MQVIGLCRFSYPAIGGFQVEHESPQARAAYLYAPARMEERFRTFETVTLPALRGQTDRDFTFLIVIGDDLPDLWRDRLQALVADMPQAVIQAHAPGPHRSVMQEAINSVRSFDGTPSLQFRMDDDDAVALSYVEKLREVAVNMNVGHLMLLLQYGNMSKDLANYNTQLFAEKVMPQIHGLFDDEWEDHWWPKPMPKEERAVPAPIKREAAE